VPHLAAGEHAAAVGSKRRGIEGMVVKSLKFTGTQRFYPLCVIWLKFVKSIKNYIKTQK
jgi:hypothetical protein